MGLVAAFAVDLLVPDVQQVQYCGVNEPSRGSAFAGVGAGN